MASIHHPSRRRAMRLLAGVLLATAAWAAQADIFPSRPIKFVVPYPPGGASDVTARLIADKLGPMLGQPVIVDNRPGANGIVALEAVSKSPADGYTILMGNVGPNAINAGLYPKLPYDPLKSFAPIMLTTTVPLVLLVNPASGITTTQQLVAQAKASPGNVKFASGGLGSATHLTAELFKDKAGIDIVHVPYKGDMPAMIDVMGGHVNFTFATAIAAAPFIAQGRVRVLATASRARPKSLAQYPTVAEAGLADFESTSWGGVLAPAGTPQPVIALLHDRLAKVMELPDLREKLEKMGVEVVGSTPEQFAGYLRSEIVKWTTVIKAAGVTAE
ncbi:tripartite tricarboxylate transporter substrate binding protein [Ramlibacter sp.]|uniref:Bug family tripartite tricarboxylate transporter substrate binding protein n=1 Tax=Ramlibacter sp. TaxID=1917967 RepID=UPI002617BF1D|nr:tripartite tricarboxylate transporter substrate binding protein [Ramlibacter sp.]MDB5954591.1 LacI family transcriptional regulator [Ramlibacter sp.]